MGVPLSRIWFLLEFSSCFLFFACLIHYVKNLPEKTLKYIIEVMVFLMPMERLVKLGKVPVCSGSVFSASLPSEMSGC